MCPHNLLRSNAYAQAKAHGAGQINFIKEKQTNNKQTPRHPGRARSATHEWFVDLNSAVYMYIKYSV